MARTWPIWAIVALAAAIVSSTIWLAWTTQRDSELGDSPAAFHPDGWDGASANFDRDLYNPVRIRSRVP